MNNALRKYYLLFLLTALLFSCHQRQNERHLVPHITKGKSLPVKYAKGFTVDYYDGFKVLSVRDVIDTSKLLARYILLNKGVQAPLDFKDAMQITQPVRKVVCISTTHIAEMLKLGLADSIAGITNTSFIYDSLVTEKVKNNEIANLGNDDVNFEKLVELNPSFVTTSGGYDGGDKLKLKLDALNVKSVIDLDYKEQDPLGRAEWLKFIAAFYDKEQLADSIFSGIETNYLSLREKVKSVTTKPAVFCNLPYKEIWYMPSGENYMARLFADAGGDFLWHDANSTNGLNLSLNYEAVYNRAANADYWLNTGFANSLEEIKDADNKNAFFKAFKTGQVYNNNKRNTPGGGFDFWESGVVNPDKILADLIFIFHPELLPGHEMYYYQKLKPK